MARANLAVFGQFAPSVRGLASCDDGFSTMAASNVRRIEEARDARTRRRAKALRPEDLRDPTTAATAAGLVYTDGTGPGITRRRAGKSFSYLRGGKVVRDAATVDRARRLAIPPAWVDVWICPDERGHIQAHGRDARGRKQYKYHARWRTVRDHAKYGDIARFVRALPRLRERLAHDLASPRHDKNKVVATIVHIMEQTRIRVGNDEYAKQNQSYGLTTLLDRHATIRGGVVELRFRGKSGKEHAAAIHDRRIAAIVKKCRDVRGQRLFQYVDADGKRHGVSSTDVNEYLREATGLPFTAKMFRTWAGTMGAALLLSRAERATSQTHGKKQIKAAIDVVARTLGNTPAVCRSSYVHPVVLDAYLAGTLHGQMTRSMAAAARRRPSRLEVEECAVLHLVIRLSGDTRPAPVLVAA